MSDARSRVVPAVTAASGRARSADELELAAQRSSERHDARAARALRPSRARRERPRRADAPRHLAGAGARFGHGVRIGRGVLFLHPETFEIGGGVFIGEQAIIQGRFDGAA